MSTVRSILEASLQDLDDAIADFREASFQSCESVLVRVVHTTDTEPLAGFLTSVLPPIDFESWLAKTTGSVGSMAGSGVLEWPPDRPARVAMQIALCRAVVAKKVQFLRFVHDQLYSERDLAGHVDAFATKLLDPLARDIERLMQSRPAPPVLIEVMGTLPTSGDATLDALLNDARLKYKDPSPKARAEATEKLWDAWERLKTLDIQGDKRLSVARLLDQSSPEPQFRALLEREAKELTSIGNEFQIRHFETGKAPVGGPEHNDYLFHRLFAIIHLLLFTRRQRRDDS
jgi:hypothetical protein